MRAYLALPLMVPLAGCAGGANLLAGGASFGTEVIARGIVGKIDNDGGLFGQDTSTINYSEQTLQQQARQRQLNPGGSGKGDKGTTIIYQGGATAGGGGYGGPGGYNTPGYGGGYAVGAAGGYGYGPLPPPYYGRGW